jgi:hypothetical protein
MMVKVFPENKARLAELYRYSNLDVVPGEQPDQPDVIGLPEDLEFLTAHGYRYAMIHQNLEQFYASRLEGPATLMGGYKTYVEIQAAMDSIHNAHPGIATAKWSIGATAEGRQQWVMLITNLADSATAKPECFYNSLIHAREPAAMECNFYFMNWLTDNYGTDPQATYLVNNRRLYFLPCVNPDGYVYNQTTNPNGGGQWRKNRRVNGDGSYGVDLNRNFDAAWGIDDNGSSPIPSDLTYRGPSAFSELETQHIRDFVNSRHFVTEQDYHTFSDDILIPWGTSYYPPPSGNGLCADDATFRMILDSMNYFIHSINGVWYLTGTPWEVLYNTNGGSFDWEYGDASHSKIYALTTEVGNQSDGFWPTPSRILPLAQENLPSLMFLARIAGTLAPRPYQITNLGPCESELSGNGNGVIEPGETVNYQLSLMNSGTSALANLQGQLSSTDPNITITGGTASWATLNPNQTGSNSTPFHISVSATSPAPYMAPMSLHLTATGLDTTLALNATVGASAMSDNVEGGVGGWTTGGTNNPWHISTRRAQSATHSWFAGNETGNYGDNINAYLLSPVMILGPGAEISYDQWYATEAGFDFCYFEMNTGTGWTLVGTNVSGSSGAWLHVTRTLNIACAGTAVQFRFRMTSDANTAGEGWYIDNIATSCPVPPVISVTPSSVTAHASMGGTDTQTLHICNTGGCSLTWSATYSQTTPLSTFAHLPSPEAGMLLTVPAEDPAENVTDKYATDARHGRNQLDNQGGPDAFGYTWKDSNEPNGPVYNWVELAGLGTRMSFTVDDTTIAVTLPWNFPFYGTNYSTARISGNGNIHFSVDTLDYGNRSIPSIRLPNAMICPLWDDLSPQNSAGIYYYNDTANGRFIVQYDSVPHFNTTIGLYTFEAILYNTGRIVFQYQSLSGALNSCTVGIENAAGTVGLQVVNNAAYLANNLAIQLQVVTPWMTFGGAASGSLSANQCADVTLNFAAGSLPVGTYTAEITVQTNDTQHNPVVVPVSFAVGQLTPPARFVIHCDPSNATLVLTWQSTGAPHYRVYSATTLDGPYTTLVGNTTSPTLTIPVPAEAVLYYHVVSSDQ